MSHSAIAVSPERWWQRVAALVNRIIGVPDYERYVRYMENHHPECALQSRDEFMTERTAQKYTRPGSRCC